MTESNVYKDGFSQSFADPDSFLRFLGERKETSSWLTAKSQNIQFQPVEKGTPLAKLYMQIYDHDGRADVLADTMENTGILLSVGGEEYGFPPFPHCLFNLLGDTSARMARPA